MPMRRPGLLILRSFLPVRTPLGFAVPRHARTLPLDGRTYFRLRNGTLVDASGESVDTPSAFRLAEVEAGLRAEADAPSRLPSARLRLAARLRREAWIALLLASLVGYTALGFYLAIVLPGRLLGLW
jgi:hypothetical protein